MDICKYLVDESTFDRMKAYGDYECDSFDTFMAWNKQCIDELNNDDRVWVTGLCKRISRRAVSLMDEEYCSSHYATNIYFDKNKHVCIMNPR